MSHASDEFVVMAEDLARRLDVVLSSASDNRELASDDRELLIECRNAFRELAEELRELKARELALIKGA
jgi:hypothetical protein